MAAVKTLTQTISELRALVRAPASRRAEAAPLVARLVVPCRTLSIEQRVNGIVIRLQGQPEGAGAAYLVTCVVPDPAGMSTLTTAEAAVAAQLCEGRTLAQIARLRGVTANTVKSQVRVIFRKLNVDSRVALVRLLCL
jgi:DNA-binding NarL/FixJ family response regulator